VIVLPFFVFFENGKLNTIICAASVCVGHFFPKIEMIA
jgi:hypothetical protein